MKQLAVKTFLAGLTTSSAAFGRIYYFPTNGNAGDALINMGFYALADELRLQFEQLDRSQTQVPTAIDTVIIGGGGTLVPEWSATSAFLTEIRPRCPRVIILPHSIRGVDHILNGLPAGSVIFCREKYSYEYCKNTISDNVELYFDHDVAFHANVNAILSSDTSLPQLTPKNVLRLIALRYHHMRSCWSTTVHAIRCDKEANPLVRARRVRWNDLSTIAAFGAADRASSLYSARAFLAAISGYREIHTDRLHVAIASSLLAKNTYLYNNSYYKIRGVFEASMSKYSNVTMMQ